jgi:hypothetical protein
MHNPNTSTSAVVLMYSVPVPMYTWPWKIVGVENDVGGLIFVCVRLLALS